MINPAKFLARGLLAVPLLGGGANQLRMPGALKGMVEQAEEKYLGATVADGATLVKLNGTGMVVAGAAMALGIRPRTSALALVALLVPTTVVGHPFWEKEGAERFQQTNEFFGNTAMIGGLLMVALDRKKK